MTYDNRAVPFAKAVWEKVVFQEDFEDTQKSEAFDRCSAAQADR